MLTGALSPVDFGTSAYASFSLGVGKMKVSLEKQGKNVVTINLEVEAEKTQRAYESACRRLSHKVNIPGFRRGKAPKAIIEKTLGEEYIKHDALENFVPELIHEAISQEKLDIITEPEVESYNFELGKPLTLTAKCELRPEVTLGKYQGVDVKVPQSKVPPEAVEAALKQIAESKASMTDVPARAVAMGDTVVLDFECFHEGKPVDGGSAQGLMLEMKEGNFFEGFCEQVIGKQPEDKLDVKVKFPSDYRNKDLAGKDTIFKTHIRGLREKKVPDINDELAKTLGQESLAALKEIIKERMGDEVKEENETRKQKHVVQAVVANAEVDLPDTMVEREAEMLLEQAKRMFERGGVNWQEFQEKEGFAKMKEDKVKEARERVLTSLVLGAVVRAENMNVEPDELNLYLAEMAESYQVPLERVQKTPELMRKGMEEVLAQKVVDFLVSRANIEFVEEEAKAEAEKVSV